MTRYAAILVSFVFFIMPFSCSYKLVRESQKKLPSGIENFSIPLAKNMTIEAGLEDMFTQEIRKRFFSDGRVKIVGPKQSDTELSCIIKGLNVKAASYDEEGRISVENATIEVECRLAVPSSGSVVWKSGKIKASEEYPVSDDYLLNEQLKKTALKLICADISESVRSRLLDTF